MSDTPDLPAKRRPGRPKGVTASEKTARKTATVVRSHGRGKLLAGAQYGNKGGGRPSDAFKEVCRYLASRDETVAAVDAILRDPDHPAFWGALRWASEHGYGRPVQALQHEGAEVSIIRVIREDRTIERGDARAFTLNLGAELTAAPTRALLNATPAATAPAHDDDPPRTAPTPSPGAVPAPAGQPATSMPPAGAPAAPVHRPRILIA